MLGPVVVVWLAATATPPGLPVVALDAGHGGELTGTVGVCGAKEKDVALAIARETGQVIDATGRAQAVLVRATDADVALDERARRAAVAGAALMVSIHANASPRPEHSGIETYFLSHKAADRRAHQVAQRENALSVLRAPVGDDVVEAILGSLSLRSAHGESKQLADRLQTSLQDKLARRGRGVLQAPFLVLMHAEVPAALVEVGFLSNPEECALLATVDYQRRVAQALASAILIHLVTQPRLAALP